MMPAYRIMTPPWTPASARQTSVGWRYEWRSYLDFPLES
jgi:hypothetical protein